MAKRLAQRGCAAPRGEIGGVQFTTELLAIGAREGPVRWLTFPTATPSGA